MCDIISKSGPSIGPCGTPEVTGNKQEDEPFSHTSLLQRYCVIYLRICGWILMFLYFATGVCGEPNQKPCCNQRTRILGQSQVVCATDQLYLAEHELWTFLE